MQLYVKGKLHNTYERVPFVNKETGVQGETVFGLQLIVDETLKMVLLNQRFMM
ncbi:hypothetical protein [Halarcobacter sp.]|uniref:hypothetical protein n=1 Tax=Halarcobacter sp. TaxID=2321133 RepID=UPI0029F4D828|nr:hypothetical protein [Halarcobacter sp.]